MLALAIGVAILSRFDRAIYHWAIAFRLEYRVRLRDWMEAWSVMGWVPTWWMLAWASWLIARERRRRGDLRDNPLRPMPLAVAPVLAGLSAEILKLLIRRERPAVADGAYSFRAYSDGTFDGNGLGMPSGEVSVAFAAAFVLYRAFPAARFLWWFLAAGCAAGRMFEGKHFATDTWVGALVGTACAHWVWERAQRPAS
jgi:membrane-associated phospholipid phosphatase